MQNEPKHVITDRMLIEKMKGEKLLSGIPSNSGIVLGYVRNIGADDYNLSMGLQQGEIIVSNSSRVGMNLPDTSSFLKKASAMVLDHGALTCGASILSRELNIPYIPGTGNATTILQTGMRIIVDGTTGGVYRCVKQEFGTGLTWEAALIEIQQQVSKTTYQTWFKETEGLAFDGSHFLVGVSNAFVAEYLGKCQRTLIEQTLTALMHTPINVRFQFDWVLKSNPSRMEESNRSIPYANGFYSRHPHHGARYSRKQGCTPCRYCARTRGRS